MEPMNLYLFPSTACGSNRIVHMLTSICSDKIQCVDPTITFSINCSHTRKNKYWMREQILHEMIDDRAC